MNQQRMSPPHIQFPIDSDKVMDPNDSKLDPTHSSRHQNHALISTHVNAINEDHTRSFHPLSPDSQLHSQNQAQVQTRAQLQAQLQPRHDNPMKSPSHEPYGELVPVSSNNPQNKHNFHYPARRFGVEHGPQYAPLLSENPTGPYATTEAFQKLHQKNLDDTREEYSLGGNFNYYPHRDHDIIRSLDVPDANFGLERDAYLSTLRMSNHRSTLSTSSMVSVSRDPPSFIPSSTALMRPDHGHTPQPLQYQLLDDPSIQPFPSFTGDTLESGSQGRSFRPSSMYHQLASYSNSVSPRRMSRRSSLNMLATYGGHVASRYSTPHSPGPMNNASAGNKVSKSLHVPKSKAHGHTRLRSQIVTTRPLVHDMGSAASQSISDFQQVGALDLSYAYPAAAGQTSLSTVPGSSSRTEEELISPSMPYLANPVTSGATGNYSSTAMVPFITANATGVYENLVPAAHIDNQPLATRYNAPLQRHSFPQSQERDPHFEYPQQLELMQYSQHQNPSFATRNSDSPGPQEQPHPSITRRVSQIESARNQTEMKLENIPIQHQEFSNPSFQGHYSCQNRDLPSFSEPILGFANSRNNRLSSPPSSSTQNQDRPQYMEYASFHDQYLIASCYPEPNAVPIAGKSPAYSFIPSPRASLAMVNLAVVDTASPPPTSPTQTRPVYHPTYYDPLIHGQAASSTTGPASSLDQPPQLSAIAYTLPPKMAEQPDYPQLQRAHQLSMPDLGGYHKIQPQQEQTQHFIPPPETFQTGPTEITASGPSVTKDSRQDSTEVDIKKKHKCPICEARFQRPEHVKRHLKSHSLEKPYLCEERECNKRFNRKDNLKAHLKKIHGKSV